MRHIIMQDLTVALVLHMDHVRWTGMAAPRVPQEVYQWQAFTEIVRARPIKAKKSQEVRPSWDLKVQNCTPNFRDVSYVAISTTNKL